MMGKIPAYVPLERERWNEQARIKEAVDYIGYGIEEGFFDEETFHGMDTWEMVDWAEGAMAKGDLIANG